MVEGPWLGSWSGTPYRSGPFHWTGPLIGWPLLPKIFRLVGRQAMWLVASELSGLWNQERSMGEKQHCFFEGTFMLYFRLQKNMSMSFNVEIIGRPIRLGDVLWTTLSCKEIGRSVDKKCKKKHVQRSSLGYRSLDNIEFCQLTVALYGHNMTAIIRPESTSSEYSWQVKWP